jgi:hypothetical protein
MNAPATAQALMPQVSGLPPAQHGKAEPAAHAGQAATSQRLSVWDERARKMGFPPSSR